MSRQQEFVIGLRDAKRDEGRELEILHETYAVKDKPSLHKASNETITDYIIRAETILMSLRRADEHINYGLPDLYKPIVVQTTQKNDILTFGES